MNRQRTVVLVMCLAGWLDCMAQPTQPPVKGLEVLSATMDRQTHSVAVQLHNASSKTVTAWALRFIVYANSTQIADAGVGQDLIGPSPYPSNNPATSPIPTGQIVTVSPFTADPTATSVEVSVTGIVYADRTWEGKASTMFFQSRRRAGDRARQALDILRTYPATSADRRTKLEALFPLNDAGVLAAVANSLNLPNLEAIHSVSNVSQQQWSAIQAELTRQAEWYETNSQPQGENR